MMYPPSKANIVAENHLPECSKNALRFIIAFFLSYGIHLNSSGGAYFLKNADHFSVQESATSVLHWLMFR